MMTGLNFLLAVLLWPGHAVIWTWPLNLAYSQPWPKPILRAIRAFCGFVIVIVPILITVWSPTGPLEWRADPLMAIYLTACAVLAWFVLPIITIRRLTRKPVAPLRSETSVIHDIRRELGQAPVEAGLHGVIAKLPGNCVFEVEFTRLTLAPPRLPAALDGLTILHLSDLHFIGTPTQPFFQKIIEHCLELGTPDLVVVTGDLVDTKIHHRWIMRLLKPLRWDIAGLAILGNHDWLFPAERIRRRLRHLGFSVLANTATTIAMRGVPVHVIGHEGPWFVPAPEISGLPSEGFRLLLSHSPDNLPWAKRHDIDLMLSGHNHGGQIRIPGFGPIFVPSRFSRRYDMGTFFEAPTLMHVNRGISGKTALRVNCRPQVSWLVLKSES